MVNLANSSIRNNRKLAKNPNSKCTFIIIFRVICILDMNSSMNYYYSKIVESIRVIYKIDILNWISNIEWI